MNNFNWIPVEDKLPERLVDCLVTYEQKIEVPYEKTVISMIEDRNKYIDEKNKKAYFITRDVGSAFYDEDEKGKRWFQLNCEDFPKDLTVVAWQYIPDPYEFGYKESIK